MRRATVDFTCGPLPIFDSAPDRIKNIPLKVRLYAAQTALAASPGGSKMPRLYFHSQAVDMATWSWGESLGDVAAVSTGVMCDLLRTAGYSDLLHASE